MRLAVVALVLAALTIPLTAQEAVIRVTDADARKAAVQAPVPTYPVIARQMRVSGRVVVDAHIDADGKVEKVEPVSGNPILTSAAVSAVKRWKFSPFQADGKAARAVAALSFDFKL
jgi:TonB family protein